MSRLIKPFGKRNSRFIHPDEARRQLDEMAMPAEPDATQPPATGNLPRLIIENLPDRYRMHNVLYRNGIYVVDWTKEMLDRGAGHDQDQWLKKTCGPEAWKLPNAQLYYACLAALYHNKDTKDIVQKDNLNRMVDNLFKMDIDANVPHTSTGVTYTPSGPDKIVHNINYVDVFSIEADLSGHGGLVNADSQLELQMNALLGTSDITEVERVFEWLSNRKPYLFTLQKRFNQTQHRAVVFGYDNSREKVLINTKEYPREQRQARGVFVRSMEQEMARCTD